LSLALVDTHTTVVAWALRGPIIDHAARQAHWAHGTYRFPARLLCGDPSGFTGSVDYQEALRGFGGWTVDATWAGVAEACEHGATFDVVDLSRVEGGDGLTADALLAEGFVMAFWTPAHPEWPRWLVDVPSGRVWGYVSTY
ncbi:MAG: hypothetical protein KC656_31205, partial [Myxococcales bacterium]|nr:hypothetical protein [Myxococcales bacterium]